MVDIRYTSLELHKLEFRHLLFYIKKSWAFKVTCDSELTRVLFYKRFILAEGKTTVK